MVHLWFDRAFIFAFVQLERHVVITTRVALLVAVVKGDSPGLVIMTLGRSTCLFTGREAGFAKLTFRPQTLGVVWTASLQRDLNFGFWSYAVLYGGP